MLVIREAESATLISHALALEAVREALIAAVEPGTVVFPTVRGHGPSEDHVFGLKSATTTRATGLKVGTYWPSSDAVGLPRHGTTTLLLDPVSGRVAAVVEAATVNAYRTAAADAAAASVLARDDARTLAVFGAGHQAAYEVRALAEVRPLEAIVVVARDPDRAAPFVDRLVADGFRAELADARAACEAADVVVTATPSTAPLFDDAWIRPGTHVASMGSDTPGKQELPPALLRRARLFCDLPSQSVRIGELQHVADEIASGALRVTAIGEVLAGRTPARTAPEEITVFDSSGIAVQDLVVAARLVELVQRTGRASSDAGT